MSILLIVGHHCMWRRCVQNSSEFVRKNLFRTLQDFVGKNVCRTLKNFLLMTSYNGGKLFEMHIDGTQ
jgi:hypothetical protein